MSSVRPLKPTVGFPARSWGIYQGAANKARFEWLLGQVHGHVLEVGCGAGYSSCVLAAAADHVTGIDTDPLLITQARQLAALNAVDNVTFRIGSAYEAHPSFDVVCLPEVLEHLEFPNMAANRAMAAALLVIATVPMHGRMRNTPGHIQDFTHADLGTLFPRAVITDMEPFTLVVWRRG